jgi:guanylate kinase
MSGIFVVSAPSGAGKTTLNRRLLEENSQIEMSVSYTARSPRVNEENGVHYNFISTEEFQTLIDSNKMLEYANVFDTYYGTSKSEIDRIKSLDKSVLLEIDVQGWEQAKEKLEATSIFILPPTGEALHKRLEMRGTESTKIRYKRLMAAKSEIEKGFLYDFFIVNEDLETAYQELQDIVIKGKSGLIGNEDGRKMCSNLIDELENAPWLKKLSQELSDK